MKNLMWTYQALDGKLSTDNDKIQRWILEASKAAGQDLTPFFTKWKFTVDKATRDAIAALSLAAIKFDVSDPCGGGGPVDTCVRCCAGYDVSTPGTFTPATANTTNSSASSVSSSSLSADPLVSVAGVMAADTLVVRGDELPPPASASPATVSPGVSPGVPPAISPGVSPVAINDSSTAVVSPSSPEPSPILAPDNGTVADPSP